MGNCSNKRSCRSFVYDKEKRQCFTFSKTDENKMFKDPELEPKKDHVFYKKIKVKTTSSSEATIFPTTTTKVGKWDEHDINDQQEQNDVKNNDEDKEENDDEGDTNVDDEEGE